MPLGWRLEAVLDLVSRTKAINIVQRMFKLVVFVVALQLGVRATEATTAYPRQRRTGSLGPGFVRSTDQRYTSTGNIAAANWLARPSRRDSSHTPNVDFTLVLVLYNSRILNDSEVLATRPGWIRISRMNFDAVLRQL